MRFQKSLNAVQLELAESYLEIAKEYGEFAPGSGGNGAHYFPAEKNPFGADGIKCGNCVFFTGNDCIIVDADPVSEGDLCKLWIIPEDLLSGEAAASIAEQGDDSMEMMSKFWSGVFKPKGRK